MNGKLQPACVPTNLRQMRQRNKGKKQVVNQQNLVGSQSKGALSSISKRKCHSCLKKATMQTSRAEGRKRKKGKARTFHMEA
jgi:hypothetical protein